MPKKKRVKLKINSVIKFKQLLSNIKKTANHLRLAVFLCS